MADHAKLSASGSARWMNCPGSVRMEEGYTNTSSIFAEEGTRAHTVAEMCLTRECDADVFVGMEIDGEVVLGEMAREEGG